MIFFRTGPKIEKEDYRLFLICAVTGIVTNQLLFFNGLKETRPINAALIMVCTPLIVLWMNRWAGHKSTLLIWIGSSICFLGALMLIWSSAKDTHIEFHIKGDIMVMLNALSYGYYLTKAPALISKYGPITVMKWIFIIGFFICIPFAVPKVFHIPWNLFTWHEYKALIFILLATTFLTYVLNAYALKYTSPAVVGNYIFLQPLFASIIAIWVTHDSIKYYHLVSALMIFSGSFLVLHDFSKK